MRQNRTFLSKGMGLARRLIGPRRRPLRLGRSRLGAKWGIGLLLCLVCGACSTHRQTTEVQIKREETKAAHERLVFDTRQRYALGAHGAGYGARGATRTL